MAELYFKREVIKKELQLNALLEITQAINRNISEESLYKIFNFTLRSSLNITKLALFVLDQYWICKIAFGAKGNFKKVKLDGYYKKLKEIHLISPPEDKVFHEFDMVIPVVHKLDTLALVFIGSAENDLLNDENVKFIQAISNIIIVAIENKKMAEKQLVQEALHKELEIASDVQQFLFPEKLPHTKRLKIEASYLPHDLVGGDYYDYIPLAHDRFFICVADVSGKGVPAAIVMSNFQASLRILLRQTTHLKEVVKELNYRVLDSTKGERFITFFGAIYNMRTKTLLYVNAGHNPPLLYMNGQQAKLLEEGTTVLGAIRQLPVLQEGCVLNLDKFFLFAYTDGLTETMNEKGDQFGQQPLINYLPEYRHKTLKDLHQDIIVMLDGFKEKNGYRDDITMLSCHVLNT